MLRVAHSDSRVVRVKGTKIGISSFEWAKRVTEQTRRDRVETKIDQAIETSTCRDFALGVKENDEEKQRT